jgi:hypothetical protein
MRARAGRCLVEYRGDVLLDGPCNIGLAKFGSIGVGKRAKMRPASSSPSLRSKPTIQTTNLSPS